MLKIIINPLFLPFPTDSVLPLSSCTFSRFHRENFLVALYLYLYYIVRLSPSPRFVVLNATVSGAISMVNYPIVKVLCAPHAAEVLGCGSCREVAAKPSRCLWYCVATSFLIGLLVLSIPFQLWVTPRSRSYAVASFEM